MSGAPAARASCTGPFPRVTPSTPSSARRSARPRTSRTSRAATSTRSRSCSAETRSRPAGQPSTPARSRPSPHAVTHRPRSYRGSVTSSPDKHHESSLGEYSLAVHGGNESAAGGGAIRTPVVMANSYALPDDPSTMSWSGTDAPLYTRNSGLNQLGLQRKLAALEHAVEAVLLAGGVEGMNECIFTLLLTS